MILYLSDRGKRKVRRGDGRASVPEKVAHCSIVGVLVDNIRDLRVNYGIPGPKIETNSGNIRIERRDIMEKTGQIRSQTESSEQKHCQAVPEEEEA
jgi:hypothetical protein